MINYTELKAIAPELGLESWMTGSHATPDHTPQHGVHAESGGSDFIIIKGSRELAQITSALPEMTHALLQIHRYFIGDIPMDREAVYDALRKAEIDFHGV